MMIFRDKFKFPRVIHHVAPTAYLASIALGISACGGAVIDSNAKDQAAPSAAQGAPTPGPSPSGAEKPPEGGDVVEPRPVQPSFDRKQPEAEIDQILADGKPHAITVLFKDAYKIRVKAGAGDCRDKAGNGLIALADKNGALAAINDLLRKYSVEAFSASFMADSKTEAELDAKEQTDEANSGIDFPNDGSWVTIRLSDYTAIKAKELTLALQKLPSVRMTDVTNNPTVAQ